MPQWHPYQRSSRRGSESIDIEQFATLDQAVSALLVGWPGTVETALNADTATWASGIYAPALPTIILDNDASLTSGNAGRWYRNLFTIKPARCIIFELVHYESDFMLESIGIRGRSVNLRAEVRGASHRRHGKGR